MLAMLAVCTVTMVSCKDDDDDNGNEAALIGTWRYDDGDEYDEITFNKDHSFIEREGEYYNGRWYTDTDAGTWQMAGSKVILTYSDNDVWTLTFKGSFLTDNDDEDEWIYIKK